MTVWDAIGFTILLGVVTCRVAQFVISDAIFDSPRARVYGYLTSKKTKPRTFLMALITCPICLSVWIAAAVVGLTLIWTDISMPVWVWLGATVVSVWTWDKLNPEENDG